MPAVYDVVDDGALVIERWSGRVTHDEMIRHIMRRMHDPAITPGASVLADGRAATFETPEDMAPSAADTHSAPDDRMKDSRVAMVVRNDAQVRANMFASRAAAHGINVMVFEHFDVACLWLDLQPARVQSLLDALDLADPKPDKRIRV